MFIFLLIVEFSFCHDDCLFICIPVESSVFNGRISSTSMPEVGLVKVVWTYDFFCKKKNVSVNSKYLREDCCLVSD